MAVRFAKSIKIGNYLRLNFSKKGISATIGKKGASINIGGNGTYLNLSPSLLGVGGTGVSYRKKLLGGYKSLAKKKTSKKNNDVQEDLYDDEIDNVESVDENVVDEYYANLEARTNIHKYTDQVMNKEEFQSYIDNLESEASKEIYECSRDGDEDTVENLISSFMNNLALPYDVRVNYELEDDILYVDLDLPEIESLVTEYPAIVKNKITYKKKTNTQLKEEYASLVMSIGVFLSSNFFNLSSYIDTIVISAFTTRRDNNGDLTDQYLYSVKYTREVFENTDLSKLDDLYEFICQFENRINMSTAHTFKPIKPYEMESVVKMNSLLDDALLGLKELGYKVSDINEILPKLSELQFETSAEYLKEGLNLLRDKKN